MRWQLLLGAVCTAVLFAGDPREISGRVVDAQTGQPIVRARVNIQAPGFSVPPAVLTDNDGNFRLLNLPEGWVTLIAERAGYLQGQPAIVQPSITLELTRQAAIHGVVSGEKDAGVGLANVVVLRPAEGQEGRSRAADANADETGEFRVAGLKAGRYLVAAIDQGDQAPRGMAYRVGYYPDVTDASEAKWVDLDSGQDVEIRVRLKAKPAHEIRGRVVPPSKDPSISVHMAGDDQLAPQYSVEWVIPGESFRIAGLAPGSYVFKAQVWELGESSSAEQSVVISDSNPNEVMLELRRAAK
jgi:hypothetical protein